MMKHKLEPVEDPWAYASPAWHPTWRDRLAHRIANAVLRTIASLDYNVLLEDAYRRGFRCAMEHDHIDTQGETHVHTR